MTQQEELITALNRRLKESSTAPSFLSVRVLLLLVAIVIVAGVLYLGTSNSPPARRAL